MIKCKICRNTKNCCYAGADRTMDQCRDYIPTTNADRIRALPVEELAKFIESACCPPTSWREDCIADGCVNHWREWLESEVLDEQI